MYSFLLAIFFIIYTIYTYIHRRSSHHNNKSSRKLPPGPSPYPIIGNLLEIGSDPLLSLTNLSKTYGPIMSVKLGTRTAIVISSTAAAKEVLHNNDLALSGRICPDSIRAVDHHVTSMAWIPISSQWRALRKACNTNIFSSLRLDSTQLLRHKKVGDLLEFVEKCSRNGDVLDVGRAAFTTVLNSLSNTLFSLDFAEFGSGKSLEYQELLKGMVDEAGVPNLVDAFPILSFLDPQGVRKRTADYYSKFLELLDGIIEERLRFNALKKTMKLSKEYKDVLDSFIELFQDESSELKRIDIQHLFLDLFIAGTDTSSSTLEWIMAELIHNPEKMAKAKAELEQIIGKNGKIEEHQVSNFPYLQAVVKETLRLHAPAPFLLPHTANEDVELCGFLIPKDAQILVNVWAMGRDPSIWDNPHVFTPERFLDTEIDYRGSGRDFRFIPFSAGRRTCPGLPLASRIVTFMLASLLYHFDWKLPDGLKPEDMDMSQNYGITLHKIQPLRVIPIKV
ncbi:geraniol 8-hydroxylase-like [Senna tora]|uniref:Geraniol 8-hydroxylase-like n=1 Tax=Senna tora TaxID=362788 RepID=A0A834XK28_9FABA|nr:geraniol 8-hydroxylase-like [Senna tora]